MSNLTTESLEEILRKMIDEAPKTGAIPSNMVYWSKSLPSLWAEDVSVGLAPYEIEVNFDD
jgi:hypothetical protein